MTRHMPDGFTYAPPRNRKCKICGAYLTTAEIFKTTCEDFGYGSKQDKQEDKKNEKDNSNNNEYVRKVSRSEEVVGTGKDTVRADSSGQESGPDGDSKKVFGKRSSKNSSDRRSRK